jgi:hypothetical protein
MKNKDFFQKNKYVYIKNFLNKKVCSIATSYALFDEKNNFFSDSQVPGANAKYGDLLMESLLDYCLAPIEKNTGLELYPTYSYFRVYRNGDELEPHTDRPSCEISATVCLGFYYKNKIDPWPINIEKKSIPMRQGDIVIYRGMDLTHSRDKLVDSEDAYHVQCFLHYVDKNGPHKNLKFDGRSELGTKKYHLV